MQSTKNDLKQRKLIILNHGVKTTLKYEVEENEANAKGSTSHEPSSEKSKSSSKRKSSDHERISKKPKTHHCENKNMETLKNVHKSSTKKYEKSHKSSQSSPLKSSHEVPKHSKLKESDSSNKKFSDHVNKDKCYKESSKNKSSNHDSNKSTKETKKSSNEKNRQHNNIASTSHQVQKSNKENDDIEALLNEIHGTTLEKPSNTITMSQKLSKSSDVDNSHKSRKSKKASKILGDLLTYLDHYESSTSKKSSKSITTSVSGTQESHKVQKTSKSTDTSTSGSSENQKSQKSSKSINASVSGSQESHKVQKPSKSTDTSTSGSTENQKSIKSSKSINASVSGTQESHKVQKPSKSTDTTEFGSTENKKSKKPSNSVNASVSGTQESQKFQKPSKTADTSTSGSTENQKSQKSSKSINSPESGFQKSQKPQKHSKIVNNSTPISDSIMSEKSSKVKEDSSSKSSKNSNFHAITSHEDHSSPSKGKVESKTSSSSKKRSSDHHKKESEKKKSSQSHGKETTEYFVTKRELDEHINSVRTDNRKTLEILNEIREQVLQIRRQTEDEASQPSSRCLQGIYDPRIEDCYTPLWTRKGEVCQAYTEYDYSQFIASEETCAQNKHFNGTEKIASIKMEANPTSINAQNINEQNTNVQNINAQNMNFSHEQVENEHMEVQSKVIESGVIEGASEIDRDDNDNIYFESDENLELIGIRKETDYVEEVFTKSVDLFTPSIANAPTLPVQTKPEPCGSSKIECKKFIKMEKGTDLKQTIKIEQKKPPANIKSEIKPESSIAIKIPGLEISDTFKNLKNNMLIINKWMGKLNQDYAYKCKGALAKMMTQNALFALFKCMGAKCSYTTINKYNFMDHLNKHNESNYFINDYYLKCPYCFFKATGPIDLLDHYENYHRKCIFQCGLCFYRSAEKQSVYDHQTECHGKNQNGHLILECPRVFGGDEKIDDADEMERANHKISGLKENIECKVCLQKFIVIDELIKHLAQNHMDGEESKVAIAESDIFKQKLINNKIGKFQCLECPKDKPFGSNNRIEMRTHLHQHPRRFHYVCVRESSAYKAIRIGPRKDIEVIKFKEEDLEAMKNNDQMLNTSID